MRDEYLRLIEQAGFTDVTVTSEKTAVYDDVLGDDLIEEFRRNTGASAEDISAATAAFASIGVSARKPA
jgi:hypothetical protein